MQKGCFGGMNKNNGPKQRNSELYDRLNDRLFFCVLICNMLAIIGLRFFLFAIHIKTTITTTKKNIYTIGLFYFVLWMVCACY